MKMSEEQQYDDQVSTIPELEGEEMDLIETEETPGSEEMFRRSTVEGKWEEVIGMCKAKSIFYTIKINESRGTALHVAVNEGNEGVVKSLVEVIVEHGKVDALTLKNERGDTPLHLAATRGFKNICECIIEKTSGEKRKELITAVNKEGETPLFLAALSWQKLAFFYLSSLMPAREVNYYKHLIRKNGDSILHCAIRREFFDLALIIMYKYPKLFDIQNREGFSPLKLLATRPSAFKSGSNLIWWKRILYHCVSVKALDVKKAEELDTKSDEAEQNKQIPASYDTCYLLYVQFQELYKLINAVGDSLRYLATLGSGNKRVEQGDPKNHQQCQISMPEDVGREPVPPNNVTILLFVRLAYIYTLGLSGVGVEDIRKMKQKHKWSGQLLSEFMKNPYESYMGSGGSPSSDVCTVETDFISAYKKENDREETTALNIDREKPMALKIDRQETVILVAAKNGIIEMVNEIISKIPSAIHETNSKKKNVLLVAVENRQTHVVEALRNRFREKKTNVVWNNLILDVDDEENTVLHLAAVPTGKSWMISGTALQMMWHIKWFQYVKELVPEHFTVRTNKEERTAGEIFREEHKGHVQEASEWLKDTSESCSVVAALLAGVSFATSSTVPGGVNTDTGKPALEGRPAFEVFAMFSLIGLCFSVTALIMFLSILTSRKETKDFRTNLPAKVLLGLSSLFISIAALFATFCSGHFFVIDDKYKQILILLYAVTCLPVTFYAVAQFPLYIDIMRAFTTEVPRASDKGDDL